ncbi:Bifunctional aminoacyl-tRNA synthetase [Camponotus floridanus]|uniref:Bifunctional glutamate/proline--tRNA ligase n=1 Tax=Camponotus floridanus TaxID=104421 RepID=E2AH59_CAMFO|nr:Bifunctional aminoacyl-tRNA synthetase [Camponotus floridanus]
MESLHFVKNSLSVIENSIFSQVKDVIPQKEKPVAKQTKTKKQEGKFIDLPGAEMNKVVVRFPPEASGYLHIGHAKAALLNQYYAETFEGKLIMRFDDTNPAKETVEFEEAILQDLKLLQIKPHRFTHTSDYFEILEKYCTMLIEKGMAFVDNTLADVMKQERDQRKKSKNRDNSVDTNLKLWHEMKRGTQSGLQCCVRAKIDYESTNGCLRDPTIYRCKLEPHPRTGNKYKVYPTYDFACPIVDVIENVTHTLRTTEYHDRDAQFYWIIDALGLRRPYIWEYSRLNMTYTVLSKRKLTWFVNEGLVDGWDDPRMPTVRGILRRGMTIEGLKQFIIAQGSSKSVVFMEWDKIWAFNKKVIDPVAVRYTALDYDTLVTVNIVDAKEGWLDVQNHPKDPSKGIKKVRISPKILIERDDAKALIVGQNATFINWGNLMIEEIHRDESDNIKNVKARLNLTDKNYKNTLKLTWIAAPLDKDGVTQEDTIQSNPVECYAVYFNHIMNVPVLGKDDDFKNFVAKDTRKEVKMWGEVEMKNVKKGEIIQLQRKGFFICDVPYAPISSYSLRQQPVILFHIPDGHMTTPSVTLPIAPSASQQRDITQQKKIACEKTVKDKKTEFESVKEEYKISEEIKKQGDKVRNLKSSKADKSIIDQEVKILLSLKNDYKTATGEEWKPVSEKTVKDKKTEFGSLKEEYKMISEEIKKQGDKVRNLKSSKADKSIIDQEVKILLSLKNDYKTATGEEWKPVSEKTVKDKKTEFGSLKEEYKMISEEIKKQGDKVRNLKSSKADKSIIDQEVKILLSLKNDYKTATGEEWKPVSEKTVKDKKTEFGSLKEEYKMISEEIKKQGDKVRNLKSSKADKSIIDQEVKILLSLKNDYKTATGEEWKPVSEKTVKDKKTEFGSLKEEYKMISEEIKKQGDKVRNLKSLKADKSIIDQEVKILLSLKNDYKTATGEEWKPASDLEVTSKKKKEDVPMPGKMLQKEIAKSATNKDIDVGKTGTRLGLEAKKEENFFDWYSQVITKSGMIEYYDVSGCYILRPWSFAIWKIIKEYIDKEITALGVQECYFPIFVTRGVLEKEKTHITDFAPEVAWVTKCGESDLAEPVAIRPTSETVMYPAYAKWLRSDTELPLRLNQWNNVVRWEFKDPKPFLRTREFLWQEGHSAFATKAEADEEVLIILDIYAKVYEDLLAVPVIKGRKTEKEKFPGGDYTTTVEAFISTSGRAIQGATSHHLGQNFSKMFNIQVEGIAEGDEKTFVYQNSWGLTTRTIGVMIMVHGDDKGLVLPPCIASIQGIVIPCGITANMSTIEKELLQSECVKLVDELSKVSKFRVKGDFRNNRTPGWKFNHWELKGVPVRIELGPKDMKKNQVTFVRRDNLQRTTVNRDTVAASLDCLLKDIQVQLLCRAKKNLDAHIKQVENWSDFGTELNNKNLLLSPFCGEPTCEDNIKTDSAREDSGDEPGALSMGAKSLCIPFEQPKLTKSLDELKCIHHSCKNKAKFYTLFGRSY